MLSCRHLLCDSSRAVDELAFGEAIRGGDLQSSGLLDQEDASMSKLLHSSLDLETNLEKTEQEVSPLRHTAL